MPLHGKFLCHTETPPLSTFLCPKLGNKLLITEVKLPSRTIYNSLIIIFSLQSACCLLTCPRAAAWRDPPGRRKQSCHHLLGKQCDISLYLQQVEHQGEGRSDCEEDETPADQVGRPDVVQGAVRIAEHRGDDGHHFFSFGC